MTNNKQLTTFGHIELLSTANKNLIWINNLIWLILYEVWVCYTYCTVVHPTPRYSAEYLARFLWLAPPHPNTSTSGLLPPIFALGSLITILVSWCSIAGNISSNLCWMELKFWLIVLDTKICSFLNLMIFFRPSSGLMFLETRKDDKSQQDSL